MKERKSVMFWGGGKFPIEATFSGSGFEPFSSTINPANFTEFPYWNLFFASVMPHSAHLVKTALIRFRSVSSSGAKIKISSTNFFTPVMFPNASSVLQQNSSPLEHRPIGARRYWYRPNSVKKVVKRLDFSSSGICQ